MRIAILGNGRAPYCSEKDYEYTLKEMGHEVVFLQETEARGETILEVAKACDALFWIHTWGWQTPSMNMTRVLFELKKINKPTFSYHLDLMTGLGRKYEFINSGGTNLSHFFTVEKEFADFLNAGTEVKGHYLPAGVIKRDCFIAKKDESFPYDVIFTGSYNYHQEWPYRRQLIDWLKNTYGSKFHRWGHDGYDGSNSPYVMGDALNPIYASAKVVVGDTLCPDFKKEYYLSNRAFEVTGKGGFLIHPMVKGIEDCFEIDKEIVTYDYGNFDELKYKIDYFVAHAVERETIRKAGHERTLKDHTFTNRLQFMLDTIK
jgi:hypothetical protein